MKLRVRPYKGYFVSDAGHVYGRTGKLRKPNQQHGYLNICLQIGGKAVGVGVHRLVCIVWHGLPPSSRHVAAHLDGDKSNNAASNLAWATHAENQAHRKLHGTDGARERNPNAKLTAAQHEYIRTFRPRKRRSGEMKALAAEMNVSLTRIGQIRHEHSWLN